MLKVIDKISKIEKELIKKVEDKKIIDYNIALKYQMEIVVNILVEKLNQNKYNFYNNNITINEIDLFEKENDPFYNYLFENNNTKINLNYRRRLNSLLQKDIKVQDIDIPIVSFYSYKGGMGRTTALAVFASYYAMQGNSVVILDFDFEAPGFMNYFDINAESLVKINGVAEYIFDKQFEPSSTDIQDYFYEVSKEYSGDGEIYVMPAGNLTDFEINNKTSNLLSYLEALSRMDFSNTERITKQIHDIFNDIKKDKKPDIILIDSRTGFNDVFGITSFLLSDIAIGFFGTNAQSLPGLQYFIETAYNSPKDFPIILANSIISDLRFYEDFKNKINKYANQFDPIPQIDTYPIFREPILEQIGTSFEYKNSFINFAQNPNTYYKNIFDNIIEKIEIIFPEGKNIFINEIETLIEDNTKEANKIEKQKLTEDSDLSENRLKTPKILGKIDISKFNKTKNRIGDERYREYRKKILKNYNDNKPFLYAEDLDNIKDDYLNKKFYFRKSMVNIFNKEKYLLIGGKGTGKTYLYRAFYSDLFIKKLKKRANKSEQKYYFCHIVDIEEKKRFHIAKNIDIENIKNPEQFFNRFWLIYIWNILIKKQFLTKLNLEKLDFEFEIGNNSKTAKIFKEIINDDDKIIKIEEQLDCIDKKLKEDNGKKIILLFDLLDFVVKPIYWDTAISPLIKMFRNNYYDRIFPKIFIRRDLYQQLGNITNIQNIKETKIISLEWTNEELFAFFFKNIFAYSKSEFFEIMKKRIDKKEVKEIEDNIKNDNQIKLDKKYLKPLVDIFFGRWSNPTRKTFGENYGWFYKNLQNADKTISLRPFIELLNEAVDNCTNKIKNKKYGEHRNFFPILPSNNYAIPETRKNAVKNHFHDLANEEGNKDLIQIFDFISKDYPHELRKDIYNRKDFNNLLQKVIDKKSDNLKHKTIDSLKKLLIHNGIVSLNFQAGGYDSYNFALLYKYYLGLTGIRY